MAGDTTTVSIDGRQLKLTNLDKILYPVTGTTKAEVISYYSAVADAALPHLHGRPATRIRWPNGTGSPSFFEKDLGPGTPDWLGRVSIRHSSDVKAYPLIESAAALAWLGQSGALELHVPQWRIGPERPGRIPPVRYPDRVVFDLDPGPGTGLAECAEIAQLIRERLGPLEKRLVPVTSGSKGLHLYAPMDQPITSNDASAWSRTVAEQIVLALPDLAVSKMSRALRAAKVLIDHSQNNGKKTTIAPYSMRGREQPWVAAPRTWAELAEPGPRHLHYREVLERLADGLDPMAGLILQPGQPPLPAPPSERAERLNRVRERVATGRAAKIAVEPAAATEPQPKSARVPAPPAPEPAIPSSRTHWAKVDPVEPAGDAILPMLASPGGPASLTPGREWRFEGKYDGMRAIATVTPDGYDFTSRNGRGVTASFPELAELPALLRGHRAVLDGEIVCLDPSGRSNFSLLQQRMHLTKPAAVAFARTKNPVVYLIFDVVSVDDVSLLQKTYDSRRLILGALEIHGKRCVVPDQLTGSLEEVLNRTRDARWEGILAKRADSIYQPGARSASWIKIKHLQEMEAVIIGWQGGHGGRGQSIGALLLAQPNGDGWTYVGQVGTGFSLAALRDLKARLEPLATDGPPPGLRIAPSEARGIHWVRPELIGEVAYAELTGPGHLRHPSWRGLRPDKT